MLQQRTYPLSSKIKLSTENRNKTLQTNKHTSFYTKYARFTLKALRKASFQEFLEYIILAENINETTVNAVNVEIFPEKRKKGYAIIGRCNTNSGKIRIYPRTIDFCTAFKKKFGKEFLVSYVGYKARAALLHELLHLKYANDEKRVRELTESYFSVYIKIKSAKQSASLHSLIFNYKKSPLLRTDC